MSYKDTELTLGLPGGGSRGYPSSGVVVFGELMKSSMHRGFMATVDDLNNLDLESSNGEPRGQAQVDDDDEQSTGAAKYSSGSASSNTAVKAPNEKDQVVGWPPVRSTRNKALDSKNLKNISKYVKVGADGAPYLRKVDLEMYKCYEELLTALEKIFTSFTINGKYMEDDRKQEVLLMKHAVVNGTVEYNQYVVTYEDKDNDWMLVGDVPWKMFKESCKRIRLMKSSESSAATIKYDRSN